MGKTKFISSGVILLSLITIGTDLFFPGNSVDAADSRTISDKFSDNIFDSFSTIQSIDKYSLNETLDTIWEKNVTLVSTPATTNRDFPTFENTLSVDSLTSEQKDTVEHIKKTLKNCSYSEILIPYYEDKSDTYSDLSSGVSGELMIDLNQNIDSDFLYDKVQLEDSFKVIQKEAEQFAIHFITAFPDITGANFDNNKAAYLSVAAYLHRWFNIRSETSQINLWEILYFKGNELFEDGIKWNLDSIIGLSKSLQGTENQERPKYQTLGILSGQRIDSQFVMTAVAKFKEFRNNKSISYRSVLEAFLKKYEKTSNYDSWFINYFGGSIYIDNSVPEKYQLSTWDKLPDQLMPYYLTVNNPQKLVLFNTMKYLVISDSYNNPDYNQGLAFASMTFTQYFQTLARTMDEGDKKVDSFNESIVFDNGLNKNGKAGFTDSENALDNGIYSPAGYLVPLSIREVNAICNLGHSAYPMGNIIYGNAANISYLAQYTMAHELTHGLYNFIGGNPDEYVAFYFEGGYGNLPWNNLYDLSSQAGGGYSNSSPLRFQSKKDLIEYNLRYDQIIDVLNLALVEAVLELPIEDQTNYLGQAKLDENGQVISISQLSNEQINKMNLSSYQDFVANQLIIKQKSDKNFSKDYTLQQSQYFIGHENGRLFNKLLGHDGWEALKVYQDKMLSSGSFDQAIQSVYIDSDLTENNWLIKDMDRINQKLVDFDTVIGSYEQIKIAFKENISSFTSTKLTFIKQALQLTEEYRSDVFIPRAPELNLEFIEAQDSTLYVGDSWDPVDNFVKATGKTGEDIPFD
ncbi:bacterial Ig-like domain-containing protein, partial [Enterococcus casseliflavus]|uniref:bacterial Ig-like domain-containing protein n=1 Tax=Enterococcus casseliflavus TaxID=37734 RepID=UPI00232D2AF4